MTNQQPHPDCICQQQSLTRDDLTEMFNAGKYDEINSAFNAGRFNFNDNSK